MSKAGVGLREGADVPETLSTDIHIITAEINAYKQTAGHAIFEIGRRLKHVKENDLVHGEWERWVREEVGIDPSTARRFVTITEKLGVPNRSTWHDIGWRALYEIATLPPEERDHPHTIPSTGEVKTVDGMTVRELREVKAELKRVREDAQSTEATLRDTIESIRNQPPEVEYVRDISDDDRLSRYEARFGDIDAGDDGFYRIDTSTEINGSATLFSTDVRSLIKNYAYLQHYEVEFKKINQVSAEEYHNTLEGLRNFVTEISRVLAFSQSENGVIIDI